MKPMVSLALLLAVAIAPRAHAAPPLGPIPASTAATLQDTPTRWTLGNNHLALTIEKGNAQIDSFASFDDGYARELGTGPLALYFDANASPDIIPPGSTPVKKGYHRIDPQASTSRVVSQNSSIAEVEVSSPPSALFPFAVTVHYVVKAGDPGFYAYAVYHRGPHLPAGTLYQTRFVAKTAVPAAFDHYVVDAARIVPIPTGKVTKVLADATFQLDDGEVKTKYMQSVYWPQALAYGTTGPNIGLWMVTPSAEFFNGGPVKQGQTVHDNTVLRVMQSVHFGASALHFAAGEQWTKVYGPIFIYVNHGPTPAAMLADAQHRQKQEAAEWPYSWVTDPAYVKNRTTVTGRIRLAGSAPIGSAWVILSPPGPDWTAQGKGNEYYAHPDASGRFTIPKVVPGPYTLYATGADQPRQYVGQTVVVPPHGILRLPPITWTPITHGHLLWQIGTFDRAAGEFRNGTDARHFQVFDRYPAQFPHDVTYTVGQSTPAQDWNYAQWTWYSAKPYWAIRFRVPASKRARTATLTLGFASSQPLHGPHTDLLVHINGSPIADVQLPKTGTAGYRGGVQDSQYNVREITFPGTLLHPGWNEIRLGHKDAQPFPKTGDPAIGPTGQGIGQVMYDALRLELSP